MFVESHPKSPQTQELTFANSRVKKNTKLERKIQVLKEV